MPTSFDSFQEEIRPRVLIDGPARRQRRRPLRLVLAAVRSAVRHHMPHAPTGTGRAATPPARPGGPAVAEGRGT